MSKKEKKEKSVFMVFLLKKCICLQNMRLRNLYIFTLSFHCFLLKLINFFSFPFSGKTIYTESFWWAPFCFLQWKSSYYSFNTENILHGLELKNLNMILLIDFFYFLFSCCVAFDQLWQWLEILLSSDVLTFHTVSL